MRDTSWKLDLWSDVFAKYFFKPDLMSPPYKDIYQTMDDLLIRAKLTKVESDVVCKVYMEGATYQEVGDAMNITRQRVSMVMNQVYKKLSYNKSLLYYGKRRFEKTRERAAEFVSIGDPISIDYLDLSKKPRNALSHAGYGLVNNMVCVSEKHISKVYGLGNKGLKELKDHLTDLGLSLRKENKNEI